MKTDVTGTFPAKNIIVRECRMKDGHAGVAIGSEITGGCHNVWVENCQMDSPELDRIIRIKSNPYAWWKRRKRLCTEYHRRRM